MSYLVPKDIPNCCAYCPYNYSSLICKITKSEIDRDDEYRERLEDCPLVEVNTGMTVEEIAQRLKEMRN